MEPIVNELKSLRMPGMADCWASLEQTRRMDALSARDCMQLLIEAEKDSRRQNRNERLVKEAHFRYHSTVEDIIFDTSKGMDKAKILDLCSCRYIRQGEPVIITGAAGTGKSHLASALGMQACLSGLHVAYFNILKLFEQLMLARIQSTLPRFFERLARTELLIIDDFGITTPDRQQTLDLLEIIEDRHAKHSTIIVSQLPLGAWYDVLNANQTAADAILDRIVHSAYRLELAGESMRKLKKN
jgi:DNA replication protein DnaC